MSESELQSTSSQEEVKLARSFRASLSQYTRVEAQTQQEPMWDVLYSQKHPQSTDQLPAINHLLFLQDLLNFFFYNYM